MASPSSAKHLPPRNDAARLSSSELEFLRSTCRVCSAHPAQTKLEDGSNHEADDEDACSLTYSDANGDDFAPDSLLESVEDTNSLEEPTLIVSTFQRFCTASTSADASQRLLSTAESSNQLAQIPPTPG
eukprot:Gregarina_sp_Pseudo_9__988@NODE_1635_length_1436_cov_74_730136_g1515_i0_p2_GENE_NODE_1635_length_1436_cov_74_730136_g1515_i0NODE_1635_length_1436_cov_74_730136_g1515_i0_p2_ORF_typecomplete_len129_score15_35Closter_coat/PF01785_17/0_11FAM83/PF07894_12/0_13_NODE_1635_length_1436_cov_74_730136_g1515_i06331019